MNDVAHPFYVVSPDEGSQVYHCCTNAEFERFELLELSVSVGGNLSQPRRCGYSKVEWVVVSQAPGN